MKQKIKRIFNKVILSVVCIALVSAGCGGGGGQQNQRVTLTFWKVFEDSQYMQTLISAYRQKNPNVDIVYTKKNLENYSQDLLNSLAAGNGPDIFSIHNTWLPAYQDKVTEVPETQWPFTEYKNAFVDVLVKDFTKDQKVYGTALSVDSLALYYNKDLLGTAGIATPAKTWEQLSVHTQQLKRQNSQGVFTRSGVAIGTNSNVNRSVDILALFMLQLGVMPFSSDQSRATFAQSVQKDGNYFTPGLQALRFYTSFASPASSNYNWNTRSDYSIDSFANGRSAYLFGYSYARDTILSKAPNLNFDVSPVPQPNLNDPTVNFSNYWGEVVSKQSKNPAVAWDFLKFITSKEALDQYYAGRKVPSSRRDLIELQALDPEIGVFSTANLTAKSFYKPDQIRMDDILGKAIDNVILSGFREEDALIQAEQQANTLVRQ